MLRKSIQRLEFRMDAAMIETDGKRRLVYGICAYEPKGICPVASFFDISASRERVEHLCALLLKKRVPALHLEDVIEDCLDDWYGM